MTSGAGRRRRSLRRWLFRLGLWVLAIGALLLFAGVLFLRSEFARERLRLYVMERASERLERPVEVGAARFSLLPPVLELQGVVLEGPKPEARPVARIELLRLEAQILDLERGAWSLRQVEAVRPDIYLEVAPDGSDNLPRWRRRASRGDFRLDALVVEGGTLTFDQMRLPLDFAAQGLWLRLLEDEDGGLQGRLTTDGVEIVLPRAEPYPLDLALRGRLLPGRLQFESVRVTGAQVTGEINGEVAWGEPVPGEVSLTGPGEASPPAEDPEAGAATASPPSRVRAVFNIDAQGDASLFSTLGYLEDEIRGPLETQGTLTWMAGDWRYRGSAVAPDLTLLDMRLTAGRGTVQANDDLLRIDLEEGRLMGGQVTGIVTSEFSAPGKPLQLDLHFVGAELSQALDRLGAPPLAVAGQVSGELTLQTRLPNRLRGDGWGRFVVDVPEGGLGLTDAAGRAWRLPVAGEVPLTIDQGVVESQAIWLSSERQRLVASGAYDMADRQGAFDWVVASDDVRELNRLVSLALDLEDEPSLWLPASGRGTLAGRMLLEPGQRTASDMTLDLYGAETAAVVTDRLWGSLRIDGDGVEDVQLEMSGGEGALLATGDVRFEPKGGGGRTAVSNLRFDAVDWPLDRLPVWLGFELPLRGPVSGRLSLTGPAEDLRGQLAATVTPAQVLDREMGRLVAQLGWDPRGFEVESLELVTPAGPVRASGTWDTQAGTLDFDFSGPALSLAEEPIAPLLGDRLGGQVAVSGSVGGTWERPQGQAVVRSRDETVLGRTVTPGQTSELHLRWDGAQLAAAGRLLGMLRVEGGGRLNRESFDLDFDVGSDRLRALVEAASGEPQDKVKGSFLGRFAARGRFGEPETIAWDLDLERLRARLFDLPVQELQPIHLQGSLRQVEVESLYVGAPTAAGGADGEADELFVSGTVGLGEGYPLDLRLQSTISTEWARIAFPELAITGTADLLGRLRGSVLDPELDGQGVLRLDSFVAPFAAQTVEDAEATLLFYPDKLVVDRATMKFGGGTVEGWGEMALGEGLQPAAYNLYTRARDVKVLFPEGWLQRGDAELWLTSGERGREVRGQVDLREMRFLEEFDVGLTQALQRLLEPDRLEVGSTDEWMTSTELDITIQAPETLRVRNESADLRGSVDLELRGDLARPVLLGKVELERGGSLVYAGNTYELQRGLLTFTNPYRVEPQIDLVARSRLRNYEVTLNLTGTPDRLDVDVASDPPLPQLDVLELVASGRTPDREVRPTRPGSSEEGRFDAQVLLYGQAASAITERVNTLFGFDKFRVDPLAQSGESVSGVRFTVGKRLSKDWFITYSRDPSTTEGDILEAEWQLNPSLVLVFTQNGDGSFSVDALWDRQF